jgi:thioredoxin reductase (NADPH)
MSQTPDSPSLSEAQLAKLTEIGEERRANVGDVLYGIGDRDYPFVAIIDGEVAILDAAGNGIARHGASKFLGEVNLLSGQSLFVISRHGAFAVHRGGAGCAAIAVVRRWPA